MLSACRLFFSLYSYRHHRDLHSFPTRRSSDLRGTKSFFLLAPGSPKASRRPRSPESFKPGAGGLQDRKSTRLNSSHTVISYAVFCLKKKKTTKTASRQ